MKWLCAERVERVKEKKKQINHDSSSWQQMTACSACLHDCSKWCRKRKRDKQHWSLHLSYKKRERALLISPGPREILRRKSSGTRQNREDDWCNKNNCQLAERKRERSENEGQWNSEREREREREREDKRGHLAFHFRYLPWALMWPSGKSKWNSALTGNYGQTDGKRDCNGSTAVLKLHPFLLSRATREKREREEKIWASPWLWSGLSHSHMSPRKRTERRSRGERVRERERGRESRVCDTCSGGGY